MGCSSDCVECLPVTQEVAGSSPVSPVRSLNSVRLECSSDTRVGLGSNPRVTIGRLAQSGSERLPYKQDAGGSNPSVPITRRTNAI